MVGLFFMLTICLPFGDSNLSEEVKNTHLFHENTGKILTPRSRSYCEDLPKDKPSGMYAIKPNGGAIIIVYCDMETEGKGWIVIQRNSQNGRLDWSRPWYDYKYGFGNVRLEHWLGNEYIHHITRVKPYKVRFVLHDSADNVRYAEYNSFKVEAESDGYTLRLGAHSGNLGDQMTSSPVPGKMHNNMKFTTKDKDEDLDRGSCAEAYNGGWWYFNCCSVQLNRKHYIYWKDFCNGDCKSSTILIKASNV
nr:PREDICTED: fibrinogen-like protein 1-like protein [Latimeria chalumnae]|eukprot:XP_005986955.2 PREDICTED: fibrinogen-like protein 1-like protein [Latimeria chalumnae]